MIRNVEEVRSLVQKKLDELRFSVFDRPPSDWEGFQRLQGHYQALNTLAAELEPQRNKEDQK